MKRTIMYLTNYIIPSVVTGGLLAAGAVNAFSPVVDHDEPRPFSDTYLSQLTNKCITATPGVLPSAVLIRHDSSNLPMISHSDKVIGLALDQELKNMPADMIVFKFCA